MTHHPYSKKAKFSHLAQLTGLMLIASGMNAEAAESYKLRQSPVGVFGGDIAAPADNPGVFGTASLTYSDIYKITDGNGDNVKLAPIPSRQISPAAPAFRVNFPVGTLDFDQKQTTLSLVGGYLSERTYSDGRIAFAVNLPIIQMNRSFSPNQPAGTVSPTPVPAAIAAGAAQVNAAVQAAVATTAASQNQSVTGIGDTELSLLWIRHKDRLKVAAGASLYVPTGTYDAARGPNPGFGKFYTFRPGVAVTYALNPGAKDAAWDSGVTLAGRVSIGMNGTNTATNYRSGSFVYGELGAVKVTGNWAFGANVLTTQQISDDSATAGVVVNGRYKTYGFGPFLSYKIPGKDAGFNLHYSSTFGERNAIGVRSLQVRFVKAW